MSAGAFPGSPAAQPLDSFLRQQFDVLQVIRDNMPAILKVASHLTPVEDLEDFRDEIEAIYPKLGILVEACELILGASEAGLVLLHAIDAAAQRAALGLGSAALRNEDWFALASDLPNLQTSISDLDALIQQILDALALKASQGDLQALQDQLNDLGGSGGLGGRIFALEQALESGDYTIDLYAQLNALNSSVQDLDGRLVAEIAVTTDLAIRVTNSENAFEAQVDAHESLAVRVEATEQSFLVQAEQITLLNAHAVTADERYTLSSAAMAVLGTRLTYVEGVATATSYEVTELNSRLVDAEENIEGNASGLESLQTRVVSTEEGLESTAESITDLTASITGGGNLLWNAGFESNVNGWELFSIGSDWAAPILDRDLLTAAAIPALRVRNDVVGVTPLNDTGVRSVNNPIENLEHYILSGWLAAQDCTARLDYRILDASYTVIDYGTVGSTTAAVPSSLAAWPRIFKKIPIPFGGVMLQVQVWAVDPTGDVPTAWLCRGMLEQATGLQENPSPWSPSAGGLQTALAQATSTLSARATEIEGALAAQADLITAISASISTLPDVYLQPDEPTGGSYNVGDYWFETDNANKQYIWDGSAWNDTNTVAGSVNYAQPNMPVGGSYNIGDQWIDTDDGNRLYRWNGTAWVDISDARIAAQGTAISELSTRVTNAELINTSQSSALTMLQNMVSDPVTGLPSRASAAALSLLDTRVTAAEGQVFSQSELLFQLRAEVINANLNLAANAAGLSSITARVVETENELDSLTRSMMQRLEWIQADNIISPDEKPQLILDYQAILDEKAGIEAQADLYGVTTEKTAYMAAVAALTAYLGTLTSPTAWNDVSGYTNLT